MKKYEFVNLIDKNVIDVWHATFLSHHIQSNKHADSADSAAAQETPTDYLRIMFLWNQCRHSRTIKGTKYH